MKWKSYFLSLPLYFQKKERREERKKGREEEKGRKERRKKAKQRKQAESDKNYLDVLGMLHADVCVYDCVGTCMLDFS